MSYQNQLKSAVRILTREIADDIVAAEIDADLTWGELREAALDRDEDMMARVREIWDRAGREAVQKLIAELTQRS